MTAAADAGGRREPRSGPREDGTPRPYWDADGVRYMRARILAKRYGLETQFLIGLARSGKLRCQTDISPKGNKVWFLDRDQLDELMGGRKIKP